MIDSHDGTGEDETVHDFEDEPTDPGSAPPVHEEKPAEEAVTTLVDEEAPKLVVPWEQLSPDALAGVIEEFVTREGTEYGPEDVPLEAKVAEVRRQLEKGEVVVVFDAKTQSANLATKRQLKALGIEG